MNKSSLETPILFIIFNRKESAITVFREICKAEPKKLYIAADGGRDEHEHAVCLDIRDAILKMINWDCQISTKFNNTNKGSGLTVSESISWLFENETEGIIIEDDCLPNPSFFHFCENLLIKYRDNTNIFVIGGVNFHEKKIQESYYFSRYGHTWGWATWRRAWLHYDFRIKNIERVSYEKKVNELFKSDLERRFYLSIFDLCCDTTKMKEKGIDAWDYQWVITQIYNSAINITPKQNLINNIGFDNNATHTKNKIKGVSNRKTKSISKIKHPKDIQINSDLDFYTFYKTNLIYNWSEIQKKSHKQNLNYRIKVLFKRVQNILLFFPKLISKPKLLTFTIYTYFKKKYFHYISFKIFISLHYNKKVKVEIFENQIEYTSPFWFLHSLQEIFIERTYELKTEDNEEILVIDCGSNIGLGAIFWRKKYPNSKVICFEPDKAIYEMSLKNLRHEKKENVRIINKAVWTNNDGCYFTSDGNLGGQLSLENNGIKVETIRLKDYLENKIKLLKIDIEGAEYEVLMDCQDALQNVENIFIEYHSKPTTVQKLNSILQIITNAGFRYYIKEAWPNRIHPFLEINEKKSVYDLQLNIFGYRTNKSKQ